MSILGHFEKYERPQRCRSPSVEIILESDGVDRAYVQRGSHTKSSRKSSSRVSPYVARKSSPQQYERTLDRKYAELKKMVLEAVGLSSQSSLFTRQTEQRRGRQDSDSPPPAARQRESRRENGSSVRRDNLLRCSESQFVSHRSRRRYEQAEEGATYSYHEFHSGADKADVRRSSHQQQHRSHRSDDKRVSFDDSCRAASRQRQTHSRSNVTSSRIRNESDDNIDQESRGRDRRRVEERRRDDAQNRDQRLQSRSHIDDEDLVYYTGQLPRRKIKASSALLRNLIDTEPGELDDDSNVSKSINRPRRRRVKSGSIRPVNNSNNEFEHQRSRTSMPNENEEKILAGRVEDDSRRSRIRKTQSSHAQNDRDSNVVDERSSSRSSSREKNVRSPVRTRNSSSPRRTSRSPVNKPTSAEYHLKFVQNDDIRSWLREKNKIEKRRRRDEKRVERAKRLEEQRIEEEKAQRRKVSESAVRRWMEEKEKEVKQKQQENKNYVVADERSKRGGQGDTSRNSRAKSSRASQVPTFSRLGKYNSFPGASTWTQPGVRLTEVQRRKAYEEWLKNGRPEQQQGDQIPATNEADATATVLDKSMTRSSSAGDHRITPGDGSTGR